MRRTSCSAPGNACHPERGIILPTEFVALPESTDLIMLLTEHMLRASARQSAARAEQGLDIPLAVNLSTRDVSAVHLSTLLPDILRNISSANADRMPFAGGAPTP